MQVPKYRLNHDGLTCQFCGKECKNRNSLCNHERLCKKNPDRQDTSYMSNNLSAYSKSHPAWNKGLTKETDERMKKLAESLALIMEERRERGEILSTGIGATEEIESARRQKLREVALSRGFGGMHRNKDSIIYKGIRLNSTYELKVAQQLDAHKILWEQPKRLPYYDNIGKYHTYTADFYLPEYDIYLDPKNEYLINSTNKALGFSDKQKIEWVMEQNNVIVIILTKDELDYDSIITKINNYGTLPQ